MVCIDVLEDPSIYLLPCHLLLYYTLGGFIDSP